VEISATLPQFTGMDIQGVLQPQCKAGDPFTKELLRKFNAPPMIESKARTINGTS
jgi:hypothetical protein